MIAGEGRRGKLSVVVVGDENREFLFRLLSRLPGIDEEQDMAGSMPSAGRSTVSSSRRCSSLGGASASGELELPYRVRRKARIEDMRIHDLRHSHASHAVMRRR